MRGFILCIARALALAGLELNGMMPGIVAAGSRLGSEDLMFSYAPETDRLVFGGVGYDNPLHEDMNHPDKSTLYVQDLKTGTKIKVFEAASGYIRYSKISPSGTTIAVQTSQEEGFHLARLLVLTADGKEITSFSKVREFSWSPDSRFLAYTTGDWVGIDTFRSAGTWLYDYRAKTTMKIFDKGEYLAWSQSDHSLYIWDAFDGNRHILRYDPRTQKILETTYHGISFSPTGRYYHTAPPPNGVENLDLYETKANQSILGHRPKIAALWNHARAVGWAPEGDVLVLEVYRQDLRSEEYPLGRFDTVLYDLAHDIARVIHDDSVIGWQKGQAIVHDRGKFSKRLLSSLPLLPEKPEKPSPHPSHPKP